MTRLKRIGSDVEIAYEVVGDGYPLIFVHGLGAGRVQTTSALVSLKGTMLIAPDMLGHGDSVSDDVGVGEGMSFDSFADDVVAILDDLGIEKANVGGLSMGAGVALNVALRYPGRVNKLTLLRPSWLCERRPLHLSLVASVGMWIERYGFDVAEQKLLDDADYISLYAEVPRVAESVRGLFRRPEHFSHTAVLYRMWEDSPFIAMSDLSRISHPVQVLYTTRDNLHPIAVAKCLADCFSGLECFSELPARYDEPEDYGVVLNGLLNDFYQLDA